MTHRQHMGLGPSLWPLVRSGDCLTSYPVCSAELREGDLVTYSQGGIKICHRILYKKVTDGKTWLFLKGDSRLIADGWVDADQIIGKLASVNALSVEAPRFRILSSLFFWKSKAEWKIFSFLFLSSIGKRLSNWFHAHVYSKSTLSSLLHFCFCPWAFKRK